MTDDAPIMLDRDWVLMPDGSEITWEDYYLSTLDDRYNPEED